MSSDPFDALVVTVVGGAFLFYLAERGKNPKVRTVLSTPSLFLSTCVSVGYADVFACTPAGKAIASAVMTFGPAMSGAIFDDARSPTAEAARCRRRSCCAVQQERSSTSSTPSWDPRPEGLRRRSRGA